MKALRERAAHLSEQPGVVLAEPGPVGVGCHVGAFEAVLHSCGGADVLVQELLPGLLGHGFGRHGCSAQQGILGYGGGDCKRGGELI